MDVMSHNTDLADGWAATKKDGDSYYELGHKKAVPLGVNIVAYAVTH